MKKIVLAKLETYTNEGEIEGIVIEITKKLPKYTSLDNSERLFEHQAEKLVDAIINNLPQGTVYRVLHILMKRYADRILYHGKTGT